MINGSDGESDEDQREICNCCRASRLGRRLAYLLRYGAIKEGLPVQPGGYVKVSDLLCTGLMKWHNEEEILNEIQVSKTVYGSQRFSLKSENGVHFVRAAFGRKLEPPLYHTGSAVSTLLELCLKYVAKNIKLFDMEDFPDDFLLSRLFFRLKFEKRLSNASMSSLLGRSMQHLDFNGVFITESTLKIVVMRCPFLRHLDLKSCGYVVTDKIIEMLCKKLPSLRRLNVCDCIDLTDKSLIYPPKYGIELVYLNVSYVRQLTFKALKEFVSKSKYLETLHIQGNKSFGLVEVKELINASLCDATLEVYADCNKGCQCSSLP